MNAAAFAQTAYGTHAGTVKTPRDMEHEALARVTGRLRRALAATGPAAHPELVAALDQNRRLWSVLAVDLVHPENGLPGDLRARLVGLARFILNHTSEVLTNGADAAVIADINTAVMRGLRMEGDAP